MRKLLSLALICSVAAVLGCNVGVSEVKPTGEATESTPAPSLEEMYPPEMRKQMSGEALKAIESGKIEDDEEKGKEAAKEKPPGS